MVPLLLLVQDARMDRGILGDFEAWLRSWGAAEDTITARISTIRTGLSDWPPDPTTEDLAQWLARPHLAPWTRVTYAGHVRSWFGWLHRTGRRADDPSAGLRSPRQPKALPRPLTPDETRRALQQADPRMRTWLLLGVLAGLRAHETVKLRGEDVTADSIYVEGKGGSVAYVPTHPDLWADLANYPRAGWLFPNPRNPGRHLASGYLSTCVTRHFRELGIDGSYHRARHTYGTALLRSGANIRVVQTLMRHEQMSTTARYLAVAEDERTAAVLRLVA